MNINKYFSLAKNASEFSDFDRVKIGSILVYKGNVLSVGWNKKKTHPYQKILNRQRTERDENKIRNFLHSEIDCLINSKNLKINWNKVYIFIYREDKNGNLAMSLPCLGCQLALKERGIKKVFYTDSKGYNYIELN